MSANRKTLWVFIWSSLSAGLIVRKVPVSRGILQKQKMLKQWQETLLILIKFGLRSLFELAGSNQSLYLILSQSLCESFPINKLYRFIGNAKVNFCLLTCIFACSDEKNYIHFHKLTNSLIKWRLWCDSLIKAENRKNLVVYYFKTCVSRDQLNAINFLWVTFEN